MAPLTPSVCVSLCVIIEEDDRSRIFCFLNVLKALSVIWQTHIKHKAFCGCSFYALSLLSSCLILCIANISFWIYLLLPSLVTKSFTKHRLKALFNFKHCRYGCFHSKCYLICVQRFTLSCELVEGPALPKTFPRTWPNMFLH